MSLLRDQITEALRQRVVAGLHLGVVRQGDRLPSVRSLSPEFDADPRVILAAYRQLEVEGLVEVRPRSGMYVAPTATTGGKMLPQTSKWVAEVLTQALDRGIPAVEFPERVRRCLETVRLRAACIECNLDQITGICSELSRDYGLESTGVEIQGLGAREPEGLPEEVRGADLLVTTTYHAGEVRRLAKRLKIPCIVVSLRDEFLAEIRRYLAQGRLYFVVADVRFAEKLRSMFAGTAGVANLRTLAVDRDDLSRILEGSPTYVTQAARARLGEASGRGRVIPAPRVFSSRSAHELLSFVLRANLAAIAAQEDSASSSPP